MFLNTFAHKGKCIIDIIKKIKTIENYSRYFRGDFRVVKFWWDIFEGCKNLDYQKIY